MKSLDVLISGVAGASNGSVDIFVRGTSTRAQIFTDYDGSGAQTPTAALPLDANGGAVLYVNQPVLCRVYDTSGNVVRQFTAFETATDVEVISAAFTGTDYITGVNGPSKPTLLSAVLDRALTSFGTTDWNVITDNLGTSRTITAAIRAATGIYINVKDPAYGAVGDGVTDDRSAVQAAITAANLIGAIVWFPPTTGGYLIGSPGLTVNGCAGFQGANGSLINATFAGGTIITVTNGATNKFAIRNMRMSAGSATLVGITLTGTNDLVLDNCTMSSVGARILDQTGTGDVGVHNTFFTGTSVGVVGTLSSTFGPIVAINCEFSANAGGASTNVVVCNNGGVFLGCRFRLPGTFGYTEYIRYITATTQAIVVGCDFGATPAANTTAIGQNGNTLPGICEYGNIFGTNITPFTRSSFAADATIAWGHVDSLEHNSFFATDDTTPVTLSAKFGNFRIRRTTGAAQTLNIPTPVQGGQWLTILIINDSGGGGGVETLTTIKGCATVTPAVNERVLIVAQSVLIGGTAAWVALTGATGVHVT